MNWSNINNVSVLHLGGESYRHIGVWQAWFPHYRRLRNQFELKSANVGRRVQTVALPTRRGLQLNSYRKAADERKHIWVDYQCNGSRVEAFR